jgi:hypothetical protein
MWVSQTILIYSPTIHLLHQCVCMSIHILHKQVWVCWNQYQPTICELIRNCINLHQREDIFLNCVWLHILYRWLEFLPIIIEFFLINWVSWFFFSQQQGDQSLQMWILYLHAFTTWCRVNYHNHIPMISHYISPIFEWIQKPLDGRCGICTNILYVLWHPSFSWALRIPQRIHLQNISTWLPIYIIVWIYNLAIVAMALVSSTWTWTGLSRFYIFGRIYYINI